MPLYDFTCQDCGTNFEKQRSFSQTDTPPCDSCASDNVQRQMSVPMIHFKDSGWYVTDSKKANSASAPTKAENSQAPASAPASAAA